jgi:hypothetical protein
MSSTQKASRPGHANGEHEPPLRVVDAEDLLRTARDTGDEIGLDFCDGINIASNAIRGVVQDADSSLAEAEESVP